MSKSYYEEFKVAFIDEIKKGNLSPVTNTAILYSYFVSFFDVLDEIKGKRLDLCIHTRMASEIELCTMFKDFLKSLGIKSKISRIEIDNGIRFTSPIVKVKIKKDPLVKDGTYDFNLIMENNNLENLAIEDFEPLTYFFEELTLKKPVRYFFKGLNEDGKPIRKAVEKTTLDKSMLFEGNETALKPFLHKIYHIDKKARNSFY